jgi:membrane protease YdiL (CAAX protease family)
MSLAAAAVWTVFALFLDLLFLELTEAAREGASYDLVSRTTCDALAYSIVFFIILRVHEPDTSIRHVLALRRPSVVALLLAMVVGLAMAMPMEWLEQVLDNYFPRLPAQKEAIERMLSISTIGKRVTLVATLVFLQPVFNEMFFRGALFTPLRRTGRVETVIFASAAVETLGTLSPRAMLSLLGVTLVFAWLRGATGSIFPPIAARMTYYAVSVVPLVLGRDEIKPTRESLVASAAVGVGALVALQLFGRRDPRTREARLADVK